MSRAVVGERRQAVNPPPGSRTTDVALVNQRGLAVRPAGASDRAWGRPFGSRTKTARRTMSTSSRRASRSTNRWRRAVPGFHAGPSGRDEAGVRHSPAHARLCGRQPDPLGPGLRSRRAVPARRSSRRAVRLNVWHEMGEPLRHEITVTAGKRLELPALVLTSLPGSATRSQGDRRTAWHPCGRGPMWSTGSASRWRRAATPPRRPGELAKARRLAEDAYWGEFEASDLETAVRKYLGFARAGELERTVPGDPLGGRDVAEKRQYPSELADLCHKAASRTWSRPRTSSTPRA